MRPLLLALALLAACPTPVTGACTEMGCSGALTVDVDGATDPGLWSLTVTKDGTTQGCSVELPGGAPTCDPALTLEADAEGLTVVWTLSMGEAGDDVHVEVHHEDVTVLEETFAPEWSDPVYPNGEACDAGNGCVSAEEAFSLRG